jgi:hypothetical protein
MTFDREKQKEGNLNSSRSFGVHFSFVIWISHNLHWLQTERQNVKRSSLCLNHLKETLTHTKKNYNAVHLVIKLKRHLVI